MILSTLYCSINICKSWEQKNTSWNTKLMHSKRKIVIKNSHPPPPLRISHYAGCPPPVQRGVYYVVNCVVMNFLAFTISGQRKMGLKCREPQAYFEMGWFRHFFKVTGNILIYFFSAIKYLDMLKKVKTNSVIYN